MNKSIIKIIFLIIICLILGGIICFSITAKLQNKIKFLDNELSISEQEKASLKKQKDELETKIKNTTEFSLDQCNLKNLIDTNVITDSCYVCDEKECFTNNKWLLSIFETYGWEYPLKTFLLKGYYTTRESSPLSCKMFNENCDEKLLCDVFVVTENSENNKNKIGEKNDEEEKNISFFSIPDNDIKEIKNSSENNQIEIIAVHNISAYQEFVKHEACTPEIDIIKVK